MLRPGGQVHIVDIDGTPSGRKARRPHRSPRLAGNSPERVLRALSEAGLADATENGRGGTRFGGYVFYRAAK